MSDVEEGWRTVAIVEMVEGYTYRASFTSGTPAMDMGEPPPLGNGSLPSAAQALAAAIGNCMCASLQYCMDRSRADIEGVRSKVSLLIARDERRRLRIKGIDIKVTASSGDDEKLRRCSEIFGDFCSVTRSIEEGIPVELSFQSE